MKDVKYLALELTEEHPSTSNRYATVQEYREELLAYLKEYECCGGEIRVDYTFISPLMYKNNAVPKLTIRLVCNYQQTLDAATTIQANDSTLLMGFDIREIHLTVIDGKDNDGTVVDICEHSEAYPSIINLLQMIIEEEKENFYYSVLTDCAKTMMMHQYSVEAVEKLDMNSIVVEDDENHENQLGWFISIPTRMKVGAK